MTLEQLADIIMREKYRTGEYGTNTPSQNHLYGSLDHLVSLYGLRRVTGNGILKQVIRIERILKQAH